MDLHSTYNNTIVVTGLVKDMDIDHFQSSDCHQKTVHRQTCFRFDTQILGVDHHKTHTDMSVSHDVVAGRMNQMCHGKDRELGYRQTHLLTLSCYSRDNSHHYEDHNTIDNRNGVDTTWKESKVYRGVGMKNQRCERVKENIFGFLEKHFVQMIKKIFLCFCVR